MGKNDCLDWYLFPYLGHRFYRGSYDLSLGTYFPRFKINVFVFITYVCMLVYVL